MVNMVVKGPYDWDFRIGRRIIKVEIVTVVQKIFRMAELFMVSRT
jgi:hypothetical protein